MAQATLTITMPDELWIQQVSTAFPKATLRVLAAVPGADSGFALVRIAGSDVATIVEELRSHPQISDLTPLQWSDTEVTAHFETTASLLFFAVWDSRMPIELPIEIVDGEATIDVTGSREQLAELAGQLEDRGLTYRIEHVRERPHERQLLSDRQLEVVVAAVEEGYYDTPRRCSLTELADHLGIAKSTCSETLHRAEETIVKRFVDEIPGLEDPDSLEETLTTN